MKQSDTSHHAEGFHTPGSQSALRKVTSSVEKDFYFNAVFITKWSTAQLCREDASHTTAFTNGTSAYQRALASRQRVHSLELVK